MCRETPDYCMHGHPARTMCVVQCGGACQLGCPTFTHKCNELNDRLSENNMLYYPTSEPWTHAMQLPKPQFRRPFTGPPADGLAAGPSQTRLKQTTLHFPPSQRRPGPTAQPQGPSSPGRGSPATGVNAIDRGQTHRWGVLGENDESLPPLPS